MTPRTDIDTQNLPRHIAIIMDGNGRWATARGLPRLKGHQKGAEAVRRTVEAAQDLGVDFLTLFAFSSENWKRPTEEVTGIMNLMRLYLKKEMGALTKKNVRVKAIGDITALDDDIQKLIKQAEDISAENTGITVMIALNYGGRADILQASKSLIRSVNSGDLNIDNIDESDLSVRLYTGVAPDPDLVIRTSGEQRVSNFLMWQMAYAELFFTDVHWPDFGKAELEAAIDFYARRTRRFGGLPENSAANVAQG